MGFFVYSAPSHRFILPVLFVSLSLSFRLMGLSQTSVLAFVIDTTGSMFDDIEEAKRVSFSIIDSKRGTPEEPSEYILVPFNDPGSHIVYLDHIYPFFPPTKGKKAKAAVRY